MNPVLAFTHEIRDASWIFCVSFVPQETPFWLLNTMKRSFDQPKTF
jgi:hypothetical protein